MIFPSSSRSQVETSRTIATVGRQILIVAASVLSFRLALDWAYVASISDIWLYEGLEYVPNAAKYFESFVLLGIAVLFLPRNWKRFSTICTQLLFFFAYVPVTSYYALSDNAPQWAYLCTVFWVIVSIVVNIPSSDDWIRFKGFSGTSTVILMSSLGLFLIWSIIGGRFAFNISLDFTVEEIYSQRSDFYGGSGIEFALYYLVGWIAKVAVPWIIYAAFSDRSRQRTPLLIGGILLAMFIFACTGEKNSIFRVPLVVASAFLIGRPYFLVGISILFTSITITTTAWSLILDDSTLTAFLTRRLWFVPASLSFYYYDFFKNFPLYLSGARLDGLFMDYPFDIPPASMMGLVYFGSAEVSANNGIVADALMNFGVFGVFLWAFVLGCLLKFSDALVKGRDPLIAQGTLLMCFMNFIDSYLMTTLVSHGVIVAWLLIILLPRNILRGAAEKTGSKEAANRRPLLPARSAV